MAAKKKVKANRASKRSRRKKAASLAHRGGYHYPEDVTKRPHYPDDNVRTSSYYKASIKADKKRRARLIANRKKSGDINLRICEIGYIDDSTGKLIRVKVNQDN